MTEEIFSARLTRFRESRGLTKEQLGSALGVTARYVSMMELGQKDVEPNSSLYKLFCLMEADQVNHRFDPDVPRASHYRRSESFPQSKTATRGGPQLTVADVVEQIQEDLEQISKGPPASRRRTLLFLRDHHLPLLAKVCHIEL
jgi:transcriptional regulator with XRE-family HTH domain